VSHDVNIYARTRGTSKRYQTRHVDPRVQVITRNPVRCPFCGRPTTEYEGRLDAHSEYLGFTQCPVSGLQLTTAQQRAAMLQPDGTLPGEDVMDE
jgi:hypothetical protein